MTIGGPCPSRFSGWRTLLRRRELVSFPSIFDILYRTAVLASSRETKRIRRELPLLLEPPLESFRLNEFERLSEIADVGYRHAIARIDTWRDSGLLPFS
jgi:predicted acylesterase/phospholipase RssA